MSIDLKRPVEVRSFVDRTFAVVRNGAAGKEDAAFIVFGFQFEPDVERVHGASGKEVADLAGSHHNIDTIRFSRCDLRLHAVKRRCQRGELPQ